MVAHGWPELWYSWRHVLPALAAAGYHGVAPDMRGYGQTDAPPNIQDYTQFQLIGDVVGLVRALGYKQAVIVDHDLGAIVAHNATILRPPWALRRNNCEFSLRSFCVAGSEMMGSDGL